MVIFPLFHPTEKVFLWKQIRINSHLGPTRCFENISSPEFIKLLKGEIRKTAWLAFWVMFFVVEYRKA